ncbi:MAG: phospho-N-acetylmuramoyl-pentapeptide-transferase [Anaerolineaceae bacterium]|nr:phospho-N-acetylmuramoyl-pentapeptide-transferase [Anaerolineaceae bacterium]
MKETSISLALSSLAFIMTVIWGSPLIRLLKYFKVGKIIRKEGPDSHKDKLGTPTMGGLMIIVPVLLLTVLLNAVTLLGFDILGQSVLVPLFVLVSFGLLGMVDDWEGIRGSRRGLGMRAKTKLLIQLALGIVTAFVLKYIIGVPEMFWPGYPEPFSLGNWYIPIATIMIVGFSNAVNFTDGLDGLAGLISATAFATYGGIALLQDQFFLARFCFTIVGALFGFLWFNVHPAELFMGDAGSLAIGATLATLALMTGQWLVLPIIAIIPVSEIISVVLQIIYFKITIGKRLFKMSPIHHHFELLGWSETQVVQRFWLVSLMAAMLGIAIILVE